MNLLAKIWYQNHYLHYPLIPFSFIYKGIISLRRLLYQHGIKKTTSFPLPIIVVGNITVGGNGKTPLVIYVIELLKHHGYKPAVVSRGYGAKADYYPCQVKGHSDPAMVGDEPVLIARRTGVPVMVDPDRVQAVRKIVEKTNCNVIVADDGLQHYALNRDIEISVIHGNKGYGNGYCLPAGPMREPISRLETVHFMVTSKPSRSDEYAMEINYLNFINLNDLGRKVEAAHFKNQTIHAVAGIASPDRFFKALRALGLNIIEHAFPDHYQYVREDLNFGPDAVLIMTEKDAVKCAQFAIANSWCLPISAKVTEQFDYDLLLKLDQVKSQDVENCVDPQI